VSLANVAFDAVNDAGRTPAEEAVHRLGLVEEAAGDRLHGLDIESSPFFTAITDDPGAAAERVAEMLQIPPDGLLDHPNVLIGTVDEVVERLQERRERFGVNYVTVQQAQIDEFAPVVARLRGT
jgi:alkanesulfonate monooxygenase SsuD/methylene tetrahydromethanopterin reductase-like flavin-dependent oxidoreductase (luciferase family)